MKVSKEKMVYAHMYTYALIMYLHSTDVLTITVEKYKDVFQKANQEACVQLWYDVMVSVMSFRCRVIKHM